jgi:hypothetical protein
MLSSAATCTGSLDGCHSTILRSDDVPGVHRGTGSSSSTRLSTEMSHVCGCYGTSSIYISHDHLHVAGTFGARPHSSSHRRHTHDTYTQVFETERSFLTPRRARTQRVTADARTRPRLGTKRKIRIYLTRYRLNITQKASTFSRAVEIPRGAPQCRAAVGAVASAPSAPQVCRGAQGQGIGQEIGD